MFVNDTEVNYLAFFGTSNEIKQLLVKECKLSKHMSNKNVFK